MNSKEAMRLACKQRGIKSVAGDLNLSPTALYNQIGDPNKNDLLNKFVDFVNACDNDVAISWACEELNGMFVKNPDINVKRERISKTCVPDALKEFGDVIKEIGQAMEDGVVTSDEAKQIRKEWEEVKIMLESFVLAAEFGFIDGKKGPVEE